MTRPRDVFLVGSGISRGGPRELEDWFPGRWNPKRALPRSVRPLVHAVALAAWDAEWWEPGSKEGIRGGLVVGSDMQSFETAVGFGRSLFDGGVTRASDFLFALSSTPTAIVGIALGLEEYQGTVTMHGLSGFRAIAHAVDALRLGRVRRLAVGALTVVGPEALLALQRIDPRFRGARPYHLAVAWCLESDDRAAGKPCILGSDLGPGTPNCPERTLLDTRQALTDIPLEYRDLAAPSLLGALRLLEHTGGGALDLVHRDLCLRETAHLRLRV